MLSISVQITPLGLDGWQKPLVSAGVAISANLIPFILMLDDAMDAYIACIFVMLLTVIIAVIEFFAIYRIYSRQEQADTSIKELHNTLKQHESAISSLHDKVSLIRTKHYENLADELSEAKHLLKNLEGQVSSQSESQKRFEAKILQRMRRDKDLMTAEPVTEEQPAPWSYGGEPSNNNRKKFGAFPQEVKHG